MGHATMGLPMMGLVPVVIALDYNVRRASRESWGLRSDWPKQGGHFYVMSLTPNEGRGHWCYLHCSPHLQDRYK